MLHVLHFPAQIGNLRLDVFKRRGIGVYHLPHGLDLFENILFTRSNRFRRFLALGRQRVELLGDPLERISERIFLTSR